MRTTKPPGRRIRIALSRLVSRKTMEQVIDPILMDLLYEYDQAARRGLLWRARFGLIQSYLGFGRVLFLLTLRAAWSFDGLKTDVVQVGTVSALATCLFTAVFAIAPLWSYRVAWQGDPAFTAALAVTLLPQALPLSLPAGLCVAVLWVMRGRAASWRRVGMALAIALAFTAVVWVALEWVIPQTNQQFRRMTFARLSHGSTITLQPGLNELGLSRLAQRDDPVAAHRYQVLLALCVASIPLSLMAFGLAGYVRRRLSSVLVSAAVLTCYYAFSWACSGPPGVVLAGNLPIWAPNVACVVIGSALLAQVIRPAVADRSHRSSESRP